MRLLVASALCLGLLSPAATQTVCAERTQMLSGLKLRYQEEIVATGNIGAGGTLVITASPNGSWTVLAINPVAGLACVLLAGAGWKAVEPGKDA